ncbi:MAG: phosphodiester glycosidase family protein [Clostridia bacterium]|nr:phosphodiester glycosidase family protein [Clostridia bacterium]
MKGMKKVLWGICFWTALVAFTGYIALDTFVLTKSYNTNAVEMNTSMFADATAEEKDASLTAADTQAENNGDTAQNQQTSASGEKRHHGSYGGRSSKDGKGGPPDFSGSFGGRFPGGFGDNSGDSSSSIPVKTGDYTGDTTYQDDHVKITLNTYEQNNTKIYVADVNVTSAQYLKTAFANNTYGKNVTATTSSIAQSNNAILAINGDYYGAQESGYVIRNGIVYRSTAKGSDVLCVYADGTMEIVNDRDYSADALLQKGVWQAFSFGPALVEDGSVTVGTNTEVGRGMASNPRTAIGVIDANHYVFVVSDGRTNESEGLTLYELAQFMQGLGVKTAYNLDGGGSSTMYFNGQIVNNPTTTGRIQERSVSDIVYIGKDA